MATIQGVYVALFGRPADPTGLAFFNTATNNGADLSAIGDLAATQEYKDKYKDLTNNQIVTKIYQSLFNRDPEAEGLNFFVDALNKGTLNINNIAIAILDGAQGSDKTIVDAKIASAAAFTAAIDTPVEIAAYSGNAAAALGVAFLADVTTTAKTAAQAAAAVEGVVNKGVEGNTIVLATGDSVVSLTLNTFADKVSTNNNDTINAGAEWTAADKIDGGLGTDTFNAQVAAAIVVAEDGLKNVEILNFTATGAGSVNVAEAKQATQVWNVAHTTAADLDITNIALTQAAGFKGAFAATAQSSAFAAATGTSDAASVAFDTVSNTAGGTITVAEIETLNLSNKGTSTVVGVEFTDAKALNITGSGSLNLGLGAGSTALETVSAADFTGALTINLAGQTALKTVNGGSGSDKITVDLDSSSDLVVNAGAGADTITVLATAATKSTTLTGGEGSDIFVITANLANVDAVDTNANFVKTLVTITDFSASADAIKYTIGADKRDTILTAEQAEIDAATDLLGAAGVAASYTTLNNFSIFTYKGDAYIFQNMGDQGVDTLDTIVKVTGISDVAAFTASNFAVAV